MTCKVCGYTGEHFTRSGMGKLCCPSCGAEQMEPAAAAETGFSNQSVAEYAAMLEKIAASVPKADEDASSEFARLDAWGKKNAAFLNRFSQDAIAETLCFEKHHERPEGWTDAMWEQEVKRWVRSGRSRTRSWSYGSYGNSLLGFEVLYAAGGVVEFRMKLKKHVFMSDGRWHTYWVPCRFIDGDVRPLFDGVRMKPSGLLQTEKIYRFKG